MDSGAAVERIGEGDGGMMSTSEQAYRRQPRMLVTALYAALFLVVIYFASFGPLLYIANRWPPNRLDNPWIQAVNAYNLPRGFLCERIPLLNRMCVSYDDLWASLGSKHRGD